MHEIMYPFQDREAKNHTLYSGTSLYRQVRPPPPCQLFPLVDVPHLFAITYVELLLSPTIFGLFCVLEIVTVHCASDKYG